MRNGNVFSSMVSTNALPRDSPRPRGIKTRGQRIRRRWSRNHWQGGLARDNVKNKFRTCTRFFLSFSLSSKAWLPFPCSGSRTAHRRVTSLARVSSVLSSLAGQCPGDFFFSVFVDIAYEHFMTGGIIVCVYLLILLANLYYGTARVRKIETLFFAFR